MESDRILVMDNGEVSSTICIFAIYADRCSQIAELDTPTKLLEKKDSLFYSLAREAGLV